MPLHSAPVPVLDQDQSVYNWKAATYNPSVRIAGDQILVTHLLSEAPELEKLIESGESSWVVELRSPRTLFVDVVESEHYEMKMNIPRANIDADERIYLRPGMIAKQDLELGASGLVDAWGDEPIVVQAGSWLVRGAIFPLAPFVEQIVRILPQDSLGDGMMRIASPDSDDPLPITAFLALDVFPPRSRPDIWHTALIGAFGKLEEVQGLVNADDELETAATVLAELSHFLHHRNPSVPDWTKEDYDAVLAATALREFSPPPREWEDD